MKNNRFRGAIELQPALVAPAHQPLQQFQSGQHQRFPKPFRVGMGLGQPLNEFPVGEGKQFLLVGGAGGEIDNFRQRLELFAGAVARDIKIKRQAMQRRILGNRRGLADHAHGSPRRVQMGRGGRKKPVLKLLDKGALFLVVLDFGKAAQVGMGLQLGGQRPIGAQEKDGRLFQSFFALGRDDFGPPILAGKILAREGELLEIVLQQEPGALRIAAFGEDIEKFGAFRHSGLGIGQFPAQIGLSAVGFG